MDNVICMSTAPVLEGEIRDQALSDYANGMTAKEVADKYGVLPSWVYQAAKRLKARKHEIAEALGQAPAAEAQPQAAPTLNSPAISAPENGVSPFFPSRRVNEI